MGPMWMIRLARIARHPPPKWKVLLVLGVVAIGAVIIGAEQLLGWELPERDYSWRRGPAIRVAE